MQAQLALSLPFIMSAIACGNSVDADLGSDPPPSGTQSASPTGGDSRTGGGDSDTTTRSGGDGSTSAGGGSMSGGDSSTGTGGGGATSGSGDTDTSSTGPNTLTPDEVTAGWELLFNGQDMSKFHIWKGQDNNDLWQIQGDSLANTRGGNGQHQVTNESFEEFEFDAEWKMVPNGNSGMFYFVDEANSDAPESNAPEDQVVDNNNPEVGGPNESASAIYNQFAPSQDATNPVGQWNQARIIAHNGNIQQYLNGIKVIDVAESALPGGWVKNGAIVLQDHGTQVYYRNLKILKY